MSILSRVFGGGKQPDPLDQLDDPIDADEEMGLFMPGATQRPASVALRAEPPAAPPAHEEPSGDDVALEEAVEPPDLLPQPPGREQPVASASEDGDAPAAEEAADAPEGEGAEEDAAEAGEAPEAAEGEEQPAAPLEVKTVAAGKEDDALSMFRATGANADLKGLTEGLEEHAADDLLKEAHEISSLLNKGGDVSP